MLRRSLQVFGAVFLIALTPQCSDDDDNDAAASGGGSGVTGGAASSGGSSGTGGKVAVTGGRAAATGGSSGTGGVSTTGGAKATSGGAASTTGGSTDVAGASGASEGGTPGAGEGGAAGATVGDYWQPEAGLTWQWQLSESVGEPIDVDVYDIDWEADASDVERLHARGVRVICYVSVGSWEDFRPDADDFPEAVIGNDYDGWPGEKYVDIRADSLRELMLRRFDACRDKGFDAIEPDNMDVFELGDDSGFPLSRADGLDYARFLAEAAHERGLGIGQKNASSLTDEIQPLYQWALTESCYSDGRWCDDLQPYIDADKPVFMCEYDAGDFDAACAFGVPERYSPILKNLDLDAEITFCE